MLGYAKAFQYTHGIHLRLWSRAFVIEKNGRRIAHVTADLGMVTATIKTFVVERLQKIFGNMYTYDNVMLSCTHTHSGPGGLSWHALYGTNSFGFNHQNFEAVVNGIVKSIQLAHNRALRGKIYIGNGSIFNSSYNRSPTSYEANPNGEKDIYGRNFDPDFTQLKFKHDSGEDVGILNWFSVHATSMKNENQFISSDNKGYAAYLFEKKINGGLAGRGNFVAAFSQTSEGDISPNTRGAMCDDGTQCDAMHSTCGGFCQGCNSVGPGKDEFESTKIIGEIQMNKAMDLYKGSNRVLKGDIQYMHVWVDMENLEIPTEFTGLNKTVKTCVGALGDSFAGGTVDGPGEFNFIQGVNNSETHSGWHWLTDQIFGKVPEEVKECHYPKPILLKTGLINFPTKWTQGVIPVQVFKIADLWIAAVPAEFTTMSGRRLRNRIKSTLIEVGAWNSLSQVVISGLTNSYTHYVATKEEYSYQRYEAASTLYGPHTLNAYEMLFTQIIRSMVKGTPPPPSATPEDFRDRIVDLMPPIKLDTAPGGRFGSVVQDAKDAYEIGEVVEIKFWTGSPRNNLRTGGTFLAVQQYKDGEWVTIANDADWETKYKWERVNISDSIAIITWEIPETTAPGTYRVKHFGNWKDSNGSIYELEGTSSKFRITRKQYQYKFNTYGL